MIWYTATITDRAPAAFRPAPGSRGAGRHARDTLGGKSQPEFGNPALSGAIRAGNNPGLTGPVILAVLGLLAAVAVSLPAQAQVYRYKDENGITVLTNIKPEPGRYHDVRNVGCYGTCIQGVDWHATPLKRAEYRDELRAAAKVHGVDEALVRSIVHAESWFDATAVSRAGAEGLMQLMPKIQARFGVADPFDPLDNIAAGVAYLAELLDKFDNDWELAVAAYNAGETAVRKYGGIPPFSETREYVRRIRILRQRYGG